LINCQCPYHFVILIRLVHEVLLIEVGPLRILVRIPVVVVEIKLLINLVIDNLDLFGLF
jgi:hypothetical protein